MECNTKLLFRNAFADYTARFGSYDDDSGRQNSVLVVWTAVRGASVIEGVSNQQTKPPGCFKLKRNVSHT